MIDRFILQFDKALRTVFAPAPTSRSMPGGPLPEMPLDETERRQAAALMRVNHSGEVCAQALYQGQALTSRNVTTQQVLERAAWEETEHLNWTERRIGELGGHKSLLNPVWYAGSLLLGMVAGRLGDDWNLGFLAETEKQVEAHLDRHLGRLPPGDARSRAVLEQMRLDEIRHADTARGLGARTLPGAIRLAMVTASKVMTSTAYRI